MAIGYAIIAIKQTIKGISRLEVNQKLLIEELQNTPEILAEAVQTTLRKNGYKDAYEILKSMTKGQHITLQEMRSFIEKLEINKEDKETLLKLEPENYIGLAGELVKRLNEHV
jgi:adenylosuccinate lyase